MKYRFTILFFVSVIILSVIGCGRTFDKIVCGEPTGKQKSFIDSVNLKLKDKLTLSHVSCYTDYMKVYLKTDYEKWVIDSLENEYSRSVNWAEFLVFNKEGKLIRGRQGSM